MNLGEDDAKARGIGCPLAKRLWPHRHIGISSLFFQNTNRKEHLSGSSVGSWRACFQTTRQQVRVRVPLQHQRCFCFCATLSIISPLNDKPCFENLAFGGLFRFKFKLPCTIFKIDCSSAFFCSHEGERSSTVMGDSFKSASLSFFFFKGRVAAIQTSEGELSVKLELDLWIFELQSSILVERKQGFSEEGIIGNSALSSSD